MLGDASSFSLIKTAKHLINIIFLLVIPFVADASTLVASQPANGTVTISWTCTGNVRCELKERINNGSYATVRVSSSTSGSYVKEVSLGNIYYYQLDTYAAYGISGPSRVETDTLMVSPVPNEVLAIAPIPDKIAFKNSSTIRFPITITDTVVSGSIGVAASSSNQTLVPNSKMIIGGSGLRRYVDVTPAPNQIGSTNITVTVTKGTKTATDIFKLDVREVPLRYVGPSNGKLTILWICRDATYCYLKSNSGFQQYAGLGSGAADFLISPGIYTFELERWIAGGASNPVLSGVERLNVTINNTAPAISNVIDQSILVNGITSALSFTVSDNETPPQSLSVTASSSNGSIIPNNNSSLIITGSASTNNRTIQVKPLANRAGRSTITITVSDGVLSRADTFDVLVSPGMPTLTYPASDIDGSFPVSWSSTAGVINYMLEYQKNSGEWESAYSGNEVIYPALFEPGSYAFRIRSCGLENVCSPYRTGEVITVSGSPVTTSRRVIFVHSDLLGSPTAETNEQGNENE